MYAGGYGHTWFGIGEKNMVQENFQLGHGMSSNFRTIQKNWY